MVGAPLTQMKITDIQVINLRHIYSECQGFAYAGGRVTARVTSLVLVRTDVGETGIGAAYSHPDLVKLIIEQHLAPHLVGEDPARVEELWRRMANLTLWYGRKGVAISALGGVDIALWDLRGKQLGQPLWRLLGGHNSQVPAYASGLFWADDVATLEEEARQHRRRGFHRVKMRLGRSYAYDMAALDAVLKGVGHDGTVLVDGSHRYSVDQAARISGELATRPVLWFEEPFAPDDLDSYASLRARTTAVALAAGENEFGQQGFRELMRGPLVDIVQPDACRTGGITEVLRIASRAQAQGLRVAPHTWSDAVALTANAHVVASIENGLTVEVDQTGNPAIDELLRGGLQIAEGHLELGDRPGLGIELDEDVLERLRVPEGELMRDGNYSDLVFGAAFRNEAPPYDGA
jgi:D-galactarolactone cycloisomerase